MKKTDTRIKSILASLRAGNSRNTAARAAGISPASLSGWISGDEALAAKVEQAEAEAELSMVEAVRQAAPDSWQAAAWWLERKKPKEWGRRETLRLEQLKDAELLDLIIRGSAGDEPATVAGGPDRAAPRVGDSSVGTTIPN